MESLETGAALQERQIVIIVPEPEPRPSGPSPYDTAIKRPAGQVGTEPQFVFYLGTNTGPYQTFDNGTIVLPPVPIEWIVAPLNVTDGQCPSRSDNLRLFGVTNVIVMALALLTGCRPLLRWLTRGLLWKPSRYSAFWTWTIAFAFQIGSNAVISHLVVTTPGYQHLGMLNVFALYASRPRVNQIWMGSLRSVVGPVHLTGRLAFLRPREKKEEGEKKQAKPGQKQEKKQAGEKDDTKANAKKLRDLKQTYTYFYDEYINWRAAQTTDQQPAAEIIPCSSRTVSHADDDGNGEWVYTDSYVATSVSEFCLQLVSAIFVGVTWRRFPNAPIREHMQRYVNMVTASPALALAGWLFVPVWTPRNEGWANMRGGATGAVASWVWLFLGLTGFFTYGVSWLYWGKFLDLPGSL